LLEPYLKDVDVRRSSYSSHNAQNYGLLDQHRRARCVYGPGAPSSDGRSVVAMRQPLNAAVSGSFRQHMTAVQDAVYALSDRGVRVLSPSDPRVVDQIADFLFVASDRLRAVKPVQSRHLAAIAASDLLWVVAPGGYLGLSAAMEVGYAVAVGTPVFSTEYPKDLTLQQYVELVPSMDVAITKARALHRERSAESVLLDPVAVIEAAHAELDVVARELRRQGSDGQRLREAAERLDQTVSSALR
jgi:hypothetical protein